MRSIPLAVLLSVGLPAAAATAETGGQLAPGASFEVYDATPARPRGVTAGGVVVGTTDAFAQAFRWSIGDFEWLGWIGPAPDGGLYSGAHGVSGSGLVIVGESSSPERRREAFLWRSGEGMTGLGAPSAGWLSEASGVSTDGTVVAGRAWTVAGLHEGFRWTAAGGFQLLDKLPGTDEFTYVRTTAISGDGNAIVGETRDADHDLRAFRWTLGGGMMAIAPGRSGAMDTSLDGSVVVGWVTDVAFRWSAGQLVELGTLPGHKVSSALGVSGDGSIVVGASRAIDAPETGGEPYMAFIWDPANGMRSLAAVLEGEYGLDLEGWLLERAVGISADGTVITGNAVSASDPDLRPAFRVVLTNDRDGDGLLDTWETNGIDVDNDGTIDIDLPAMGADPMHKDLFVEVDAMTGISVTQAALDMVKSAFGSAPNAFVGNPDGLDGVNLHILVDDVDVLYSETWQVEEGEWFPAEFDAIKDMFFGTAAERQHPASAELLAMKRRIFRYCVYCNKTEDGVLGVARDFHANDFVIAKGRFVMGDPPALCDSCDLVAFEAGTFMHELGHCLDLRHGGGDGVNRKPNYISVMNYMRQLPFTLDDELWALDFSHGSMLPIDESNIDESLGFHDTTGHNAGRVIYFSETVCNEGPPCTEPDSTDPLAFFVLTNGGVDIDGNGTIESGVCVDLNYWGVFGVAKSPCEVLNDHNDWLALKYELVAEGASPSGAEPVIELTAEEVRDMVDNLPAVCRADLDRNGLVDFNDLLAVLGGWGTGAGDVNGDGVTDFEDLLAVLAAWGPCA